MDSFDHIASQVDIDVDAVCPRKYHTPDGFVAVRTHASVLAVVDVMGDRAAAHQAYSENFTEAKNATLVAAVFEKLRQFDYQYMWLAKDLAEALMMTTPPENTILADVPWPFPAFTVMLPHGLMPTPEGGMMAWVNIGHLVGQSTVTRQRETRLTFTAASFTADGVEVDWFGHFNAADDIKQVLGLPFAESELFTDFKCVGDAEIPNQILRLLVNMAYYMTTSVDAVDQSIIGGTKKKARGGKEAWWTPRWVGQRYKRPTVNLGGSHASPRAHWRRGHMKAVRHGEGRQQSRIVWIQPTLVNAQPA